MHMGKAIVWRYVVSVWQLVLTLDAQEALTARTGDCHSLESCLKGEVCMMEYCRLLANGHSNIGATTAPAAQVVALATLLDAFIVVQIG